MTCRIYDKDKVSLSTYIEFKDDKTLQQVLDWFYDFYRGALENIAYLGVLDTNNKVFRLYDLMLNLIEKNDLK